MLISAMHQELYISSKDGFCPSMSRWSPLQILRRHCRCSSNRHCGRGFRTHQFGEDVPSLSHVRCRAFRFRFQDLAHTSQIASVTPSFHHSSTSPSRRIAVPHVLTRSIHHTSFALFSHLALFSATTAKLRQWSAHSNTTNKNF